MALVSAGRLRCSAAVPAICGVSLGAPVRRQVLCSEVRPCIAYPFGMLVRHLLLMALVGSGIAWSPTALASAAC
jgi:hypothetical protein